MAWTLKEQRQLLADPDFGIGLRQSLRHDTIVKYRRVFNACATLQDDLTDRSTTDAIDRVLNETDPEQTLQLYRRFESAQRALDRLETALHTINKGGTL